MPAEPITVIEPTSLLVEHGAFERVPLIIIVLDQFTKWLVRVKVPLYSSVQIIPNFP